MYRFLLTGALVASAILVFSSSLTTSAPPQGESSVVYVANFPEVQKIRGSVEIQGLESFGSLAQIDTVDVTPVAREATTRLLDAGVIETDGFSHVVIGLFGEIRGELTRPGRVGVVLLPDLDVAERFLKTKGVFLFPLEVSAALDPAGSSVFLSPQTRFEVGFPRYRVLLYNTTDKTVIASVSAYRTK